jgi:hypothetical protein
LLPLEMAAQGMSAAAVLSHEKLLRMVYHTYFAAPLDQSPKEQ